MYKWLFILAIIAGVGYFKSDSSSNSAEAFNEYGEPIVMVFTLANCGSACSSVTDTLKSRDVEFTEHEVNVQNTSSEATKLWKKMSGVNRFPILMAGDISAAGPSKSRIVSILGQNYGDQYLTRLEKVYYKKHFYADGSPKVVMYGADWCGYCTALKKEFRADNIDYLEIDVEKSKNPKRLSKIMGISGYPSTWVGYERVSGTTLKDVKRAMPF